MMKNMPREQVFAVVAVLLGIGTILTLGVGFRILPDVQAALAADCISRDSVSNLQFARSPEELDSAFGPVGSDCRPLTVAALNAMNSVDVYFLIPLYALFYCVAALAIGGWQNPFTKIAIAFAVLGGIGDYLETVPELRLSGFSRAEQARLLAFANVGTWAKFFSLAAFAFCVAWVAWSGVGPSKWLLAAGFLLLPATVITFVDPVRLGLVMSAANVAFAVGLLVSLLIQVFRGRLPGDSRAARTTPA